MTARGNRYIAMQNGDSHYMSDRPCKRGHLSLRTTSNGKCVECRKVLERAAYWNNHELSLQKANAKASKNREKLAEKARTARANETAEQKAARLEKARLRAIVWRAQNPDHVGAKIAKQKYAQSIRGKVTKNASSAKRRAALLQRTPSWLTEDDLWLISEAYELAALRSKMLGFSWHVDHIIPLQGKNVSGLHVPSNLQVIPSVDNLKKHAKYTAA